MQRLAHVRNYSALFVAKFNSCSRSLNRQKTRPLGHGLDTMPLNGVHSYVGESLRDSQMAQILLRSQSRRD